MHFADKIAVTKDFGRIHYVEAGAGSPLILLHSNGCSTHEWEKVIHPFSARHRCIAWDMPGHGDSEFHARHLAVSDYATATTQFMDTLGIGKAHICGASIGGAIAIAMGALHPDRTSTAVIVEAMLRPEADWAAGWARVESLFAIPYQTEADVAPRFRTSGKDFLSRWNMDRAKAGSWRMMDVMWALREFDAVEHVKRLAALKTPAAVIIGSKGPVAGYADAYRRLLTSQVVAVLEDTGHFPMMDDPVAFAEAVLKATTTSA
jgi:3-oxoadipate enol-lactonase